MIGLGIELAAMTIEINTTNRREKHYIINKQTNEYYDYDYDNDYGYC